jgi:hypothetical protein
VCSGFVSVVGRGEEVVRCVLVGIGFTTSQAFWSVRGGGTCQWLLGVVGWGPKGIVGI